MLQSMPLLSHQLLSFTVFCTSLVSSIIMDSLSASSPPRLLWRPPSVSSSFPDLCLLHIVASSGLSSVLEPAPISLPDTVLAAECKVHCLSAKPRPHPAVPPLTPCQLTPDQSDSEAEVSTAAGAAQTSEPLCLCRVLRINASALHSGKPSMEKRQVSFLTSE